MTLTTLGDMARNFQMRAQQVRMKTEIGTLSLEVGTGVVTDVAGRVGGAFVPLARLERDITSLAAYRTSVSESIGFIGTTQSALEAISDAVADLGPALLAAPGKGTIDFGGTFGRQSISGFKSAVAQLNSSFAGRMLFSGTTIDTKPLSEADLMLAELQAAVASETTAAGMTNVIETWFGPGGTFETTHYLGATTALTPLRVGDDETLTAGATALDDRIRNNLKALALGSMLELGSLGVNHAELQTLARTAGSMLINAEEELINLRAEVGTTHAALEQADVRLSAETTALTLTRDQLVAADPYESTTRLQEMTAQLEVLYAVTARVSRLNLADFLR